MDSKRGLQGGQLPLGGVPSVGDFALVHTFSIQGIYIIAFFGVNIVELRISADLTVDRSSISLFVRIANATCWLIGVVEQRKIDRGLLQFFLKGLNTWASQAVIATITIKKTRIGSKSRSIET
ncbi:hypothetical protein Nhal_0098 [Nitrosococcus halophilus Nc 4]|uniref:Uncharacterized protein n=1 Tax=Nitrosococcus halophilus (strain Nc4) TaxID=472759 RepID=D5C4P5_NITHN|nr:hypothetical protein Nhal_0098 [Nitrosococcus halophilus Nc 4]